MRSGAEVELADHVGPSELGGGAVSETMRPDSRT